MTSIASSPSGSLPSPKSLKSIICGHVGYQLDAQYEAWKLCVRHYRSQTSLLLYKTVRFDGSVSKMYIFPMMSSTSTDLNELGYNWIFEAELVRKWKLRDEIQRSEINSG